VILSDFKYKKNLKKDTFMAKSPKKRSGVYKLQLVLESFKENKTIAQIASENGIHPRQILRWKNKLLDEAESIFLDQRVQQKASPDKEQLLHIIDQLTIELEFIKKKLKRND
jgi:transposase-like protein